MPINFLQKKSEMIIEILLLVGGSMTGAHAVAESIDLFTKIILTLISIISFSIVTIVNIEKNRDLLKKFFNRFKKKKIK